MRAYTQMDSCAERPLDYQLRLTLFQVFIPQFHQVFQKSHATSYTRRTTLDSNRIEKCKDFLPPLLMLWSFAQFREWVACFPVLLIVSMVLWLVAHGIWELNAAVNWLLKKAGNILIDMPPLESHQQHGPVKLGIYFHVRAIGKHRAYLK